MPKSPIPLFLLPHSTEQLEKLTFTIYLIMDLQMKYFVLLIYLGIKVLTSWEKNQDFCPK